MKKILSLITAAMMLFSIAATSLAESIASGTANTVAVSDTGDIMTDAAPSGTAAEELSAEEDLDPDVKDLIKQLIVAFGQLQQLDDLIRKLKEIFGMFLH